MATPTIESIPPSNRFLQVALSEAQQTGYHIKRNEFEQEFDPEAECIISEMEFK